MKIIRKENYTILSPEKDGISYFLKDLTKNLSEFKTENVIIDIIKFGNLSLQELQLFSELSNLHRAQKKSLVLVNDNINIEEIPDELIVAPTLLEAGDIIGMEELERDLGF